MSEAARRAGYLEALGIDCWVPRTALTGAAAASATREQGPLEPSAGPTVSVPPQPAGEAGVAEAWERLRDQVRACTACALHQTRTQAVFGVGHRHAEWMVIGEAPGAEEDRRGEPFVGRAGQLLNAMLRSIGLGRETNVYIANILKSRPPGNRDPRPEEVAACLPYLHRQIALVRPKLLLAVGRIAAQTLLGTDAPLGRLRGRAHAFGEHNVPLVVTYHPAYLLRSPAEKRKAWEDLRLARSLFAQIRNPEPNDGHRS
ncbi:MAG: uracil-DNA glycosylase [Steroidobacteraceae bacterium]